MTALTKTEHPIGPGTSANGPLGKRLLPVIMCCGTIYWSSTSASEPSRVWDGEFVCEPPPTGSHLVEAPTGWRPSPASVETEESPARAIGALRRMAGLTWDQLARLFGVSRRAVHFWASGKPMNAANEERLHRLMEIVRVADRGDAASNRAALFSAVDHQIPFDLLVAGRLDEAGRLLGTGHGRHVVTLKDLSREAKTERTPPPPADLADARHDRIHREPGRGRAAKTLRNKRRGRN